MSHYDAPQRNANLIYRLRGLGMAGAVLHIGAHPDDEDVGLMAYMAHKFGVRIVCWVATRGEGGQNRIGPYQGEALGVYRTWESLTARAVDGGEALFGPFCDFGFSKNGEEALTKWGRTDVVREIVRAIQLVQPHIVVARWTGGPSDGHGHHQAIGEATLEALEAAGDPDQFPELRARGLPAWQPLKVYHSTMGDWQPGEDTSFGKIIPEFKRDGMVRINTGEFDPIAGRTYQEQAWIAFNSHKTQAMGFVPERGDFYYYFSLQRSLVPVPDRESGLFDGLDPSLAGLADYPGNGSASLREKLEAVKAKAEAAIEQYRADDPMQASTSLLEGLSLLRELRASLAEEGLDDEARQALDVYLERKITDFEEVTAQCLGLRLECLSDNARVTPGQQFHISSQLWNHRDARIDKAAFALRLPEGWEAQSVEPEASVWNHNHNEVPSRPSAVYDVTASETAELACPYWLLKPRGLYRYHWPDGEPSGRPFGPSPVEVECEVTLGQHRITLRESAVLREAFAGGFRELPLAVIPPISLHPESTQKFLQVRKKRQHHAIRSAGELRSFLEFLEESFADQHLELQVVARRNTEHAGVQGSLTLEAPPGWKVDPSHVDLSLGKAGDARTVRFMVTIPADTPAGSYPLRYVVCVGERDYDVLLNPVRMVAPGLPGMPDETNCVKEEFVTAPAVVDVCLFDVQFVPGQNYAYVRGAADEIVEALSHFDLNFQLIADEEMDYVDLSQFDAVVIGPNAYLIRDELRKNAARFLEYVEQGGTLIVQFQGYGHQGKDLTPYPFRYNQPHDRVTYADQPVTILKPDHLLVNWPNAISAADFEGWVMDRGLYFFGEWDERYEPILACNDPGEEPKKGGLLVTSYGRGIYLYTGYSFFRQLLAGVPGAFRLFANILALPAARVLERAEILKDVPLFSFMTGELLQEVARIMSERREEDGTYLCHEGDEGNEMYIIAQGEVEIVKESDDEERIYLAREGEIIGEVEVLGNIPRATAMRTRGNVHLLVIEGEHFRSLTHQHPEMSDRVIQMLVNRLTTAGG